MKKRSFSMRIVTLVLLVGCTALGKDHRPSGDSLPRIIGGQDAAAGAWPWQALLEVGPSGCGGSLIAPTWVLTAAHCFLNADQSAIDVPPTTDIRVILGRLDISTNAGEEFTGAGIARVIVHPDYHPLTGAAMGNDSDIALIELASASSQQPVQLLGSTEVQLAAPGVAATATGWGATGVDGETGEPVGEPTILQQISLPMVDCSTTGYAAEEISVNMICAGGQAGEDTCSGDSGGPLVVPDGSGGFKQAGVVSFGGSPDFVCDAPGFPGVYTAVAQFEAWIQQNTGLAATALYFAHVGDGGGLTSDVVLANPSASETANGTLELFDDAGAPFLVGFLEHNGQNSVAASIPLGQTNTMNFSIQPLGTLTVLTDGEGAMARAGSAVVSSDGNIPVWPKGRSPLRSRSRSRILGGVIRFNLPGFGIAGVGTSESLTGFIVPVRREAGGINTGVALQNTGTTAITIRLSLRDEAGVEVANRTIAGFAGRGHLAQFIDELFASADTNDFQGSLVVEVVGVGRIAATALELGTQPGEFTTLPVTPLVE